jgi:hypothetical protein
MPRGRDDGRRPAVECNKNMGSTEDADMLALIAAAPELATPDDTEIFLDAMPVAELASMWGALQRLSRRDQTGAAWSVILYFDHLPHKRPGRALDLALEVLRSEPDKPTVMQLNDKFSCRCSMRMAPPRSDGSKPRRNKTPGCVGCWAGFTSGPMSRSSAASRQLPTAGAGAPTIWRAGRQNIRWIARPCRCRNWRAPGSSNIRNPSATATTISSR